MPAPVQALRFFLRLIQNYSHAPALTLLSEADMLLAADCISFSFGNIQKHFINSIPYTIRMSLVGQCNDAYSAVKITLVLADAFKFCNSDRTIKSTTTNSYITAHSYTIYFTFYVFFKLSF